MTLEMTRIRAAQRAAGMARATRRVMATRVKRETLEKYEAEPRP
jgi:hypothetical protein